ncbi:hypothetical protein Mtai_v1c04800 [Meiothermus taiwanensis WR-220]|uniref:DUF11 domain-containing protein n=1 Tax=Meiothermus taiwanensis WR-220 TaxID=1339250 RepID=A0ABN5LXA3_9DEIN|nr:hypothetical protein Mtai_v1c04800 [Meiothermus taiwanensis WR-220]
MQTQAPIPTAHRARRSQGSTLWAGLAWVLFCLHLAWAAPAGTVIRNQAAAIVNGQVYLSNEVETRVQAVCVPAMTPNGNLASPGQRTTAPAGGTAYFSYRLQNSGNQSFLFNLSWLQNGAAWTPSTVRFYLDVNANAQLDPGEPEVSSLSLDMGQEVRLVMAVQTPPSASGELLISPVASCPDGTRDEDNFGAIRIGSGPALSLAKSVDANPVRQNQSVGFTLRVQNLGSARASGPVYVEDRLDVPELSGLAYLAGSASAVKGRLEYFDGANWSSLEPASVRGLRLVLDGLEVGEEAVFSFRMQVAADTAPGERINLARATSSESSAQTQVSLQIAALYAHALGPIGNPQAAGAADRQEAEVLAGQPYCFHHTLLNSGNAPDTYTLEALGLPSGVNLTYRTMGGASLPTPITLAPGNTLDFQACISALPAGTPAFEFSLLARSGSTGSADPTVDRVAQVWDLSQIVLFKNSSSGPIVIPGQGVEYTLQVENPLPLTLSNVQIEDALEAHLEFLSASDGGVFDPGSRTVRWSLTLAARSTLTLRLRVRVNAAVPDNVAIVNRFSLRSADIGNPLVSNSVTLRVQAAALLLEKRVEPRKVKVGDLLTYTLIAVNVGQVPLTVRLEDTPDPHLQYLAGSASPTEPVLQNGRLVWENLTLAPGARVELRYRMRVLAGAGSELKNTVQATGDSAGGSAVASAVASASVQVEQGVLAVPHLLVGRVFLDTNRDGLYTAGLDVPLPGARVILGNGWQALTDAEGRYSFRNLTGGVWEVMLEPASAPFPPLPHPEAQGAGYRHRVRVEGLTVSDFPLERPAGLARAQRETVLEFGPLRLSKKLLPLPEGFRVVLVLESDEPLTDLTLTDPLPGGGERSFHFVQFQGQKTLTYDLEGTPHLTDPQVRWRYP